MADHEHPGDITEGAVVLATIRPKPHPNAEMLRDIIANDHFGGEMAPSIVEAWVEALQPGSRLPLPPNVKGFYGGNLKASMSIEIARGSYKFIAHETVEKGKMKMYAERMLLSLSMVDIDGVSQTEPTTGILALWHKALALVRLPEAVEELEQTLLQYEELRPKSSLSNNKLPHLDRLKARLLNTAKELSNTAAVQLLSN